MGENKKALPILLIVTFLLLSLSAQVQAVVSEPPEYYPEENFLLTELSDNRVRATFEWEDYTICAETNSSVLGVKLDKNTKQIFIQISGDSDTEGVLDLIVPKELILSTDDVKVYLHGDLIDFTLTEAENYYSIHVEYTHSTYWLTVNLIALPAWYEQPLTIAAIGGAIVVVIIALLLVRRRRAAKSEMPIGSSSGDKSAFEQTF